MYTPPPYSDCADVPGLVALAGSVASAGFAWYGMTREHAKLVTPISLNNVILFGVRAVDAAEQAIIEMHNISIAKSASDINRLLKAKFNKATYVHIDMDVHDGQAVHTGAFSVSAGPSVHTVRQVLSSIKNVSALSVSGLDPRAMDTVKVSRIAVEHVLAIADATLHD